MKHNFELSTESSLSTAPPAGEHGGSEAKRDDTWVERAGISASGPRTRIGASGHQAASSSLYNSNSHAICTSSTPLTSRNLFGATQRDMGPVSKTLVNPDFPRMLKRGSVYVEDGSAKVFLVSYAFFRYPSAY